MPCGERGARRWPCCRFNAREARARGFAGSGGGGGSGKAAAACGCGGGRSRRRSEAEQAELRFDSRKERKDAVERERKVAGKERIRGLRLEPGAFFIFIFLGGI